MLIFLQSNSSFILLVHGRPGDKMEFYWIIFIPLLGFLAPGKEFAPLEEDSEKIVRLKTEVAECQEELFLDAFEIKEWNAKLDKLRQTIEGLRKEKEFIKTQGKPSQCRFNRMQ